MTRLPVVAGLLAVLLASVSQAAAQAAQQAQLRVAVEDQSGALIPGARVRIVREHVTLAETAADERGQVTVTALPTGLVRLHVEFDGFESYEGDLTLGRGNTNRTITLRIAEVREEVIVTEETDDARGNSFTTTLDEDEIADLPEDPDELRAYLEEMTGGAGAVFQVDGFRGGRLPNRDEIRQIRFRLNSFAADNHDAGRVHVEIITRPGLAQWSGNANVGLRSDVLNARNAFASAKTRSSSGGSARAFAVPSCGTGRRFASAPTATARSTRAQSSRCCQAVEWPIRSDGRLTRRARRSVWNTG